MAKKIAVLSVLREASRFRVDGTRQPNVLGGFGIGWAYKVELAEISAAVDYSSVNVDVALAVKGGIESHSDQEQQDFAMPRLP